MISSTVCLFKLDPAAGSIFYNVTFTATGLTSGTNWSVTFNGVQHSSTTNQITFNSIAGGTYTYSITTPSGYTIGSQSIGRLTVSADTTTSVTFASSDGSNSAYAST